MIFSTYNAIVSASIASVVVGVKSFAVFVYSASQQPPIEGFAKYNDDVHAGEVIVLDWQITKRVDCVGSSMRVWDGERGYSLREPIRVTTIPKSSDFSSYPVLTLIPETAPNGWLRMRIDGVYDCPERRMPFSIGPVIFKVSDKAEDME